MNPNNWQNFRQMRVTTINQKINNVSRPNKEYYHLKLKQKSAASLKNYLEFRLSYLLQSVRAIKCRTVAGDKIFDKPRGSLRPNVRFVEPFIDGLCFDSRANRCTYRVFGSFSPNFTPNAFVCLSNTNMTHL